MSSFSDNAYARWWLKSDNDTTAVVSFNVASLTDHSTGEWTVNIATDHATANYAALAMAELTSTTYSVANMRQMYAYSGGMAAGTAIVLVAPAIGAAGVGYAAYRLSRVVRRRRSHAPPDVA